jgi:hypothetical protein
MSEDHPIVLEGVKHQEFESLLSVIYPSYSESSQYISQCILTLISSRSVNVPSCFYCLLRGLYTDIATGRTACAGTERRSWTLVQRERRLFDSKLFTINELIIYTVYDLRASNYKFGSTTFKKINIMTSESTEVVVQDKTDLPSSTPTRYFFPDGTVVFSVRDNLLRSTYSSIRVSHTSLIYRSTRDYTKFTAISLKLTQMSSGPCFPSRLLLASCPKGCQKTTP